ncbi:site-specific integrase [Paenibacillus sp. OAE614]|uniref:tyrosine-type recombinase/integrase n=1 Tax=Paenibacillus sp. OAE614 TaxID=2663804 RepID=UPI00178A04D2
MCIILSTHYYKQWYNHSHVAQTTKAAMTNELRRLEDFLIQTGFPAEEKINFDRFYYDPTTEVYEPFDEEMIDNYILHLKMKNSSDNLLYNSIVYLRSFFKFLKAANLIKHNPVAFYRNSHYKRPIRNKWLSVDECNKLLHLAINKDPDLKQDYVLLLLMISTGLRNSEITNLCYHQIDFERDVIYVDKGHKTTASTVYMTNTLKRVLKEYTNHPDYKKRLSNGNQRLFYTDTGREHSPASLNIKIKKLCKNAGITHVNVSPHSFRFTCARLMFESEISLVTIQRQLRHKYLATTLRYLGLDSASKELIEDLSNITPDVDYE